MQVKNLYPISEAIAARDYPQAIRKLDKAMHGETGAHWKRDMAKLRAVLVEAKQGGARNARFSIFAKDGNGKLPFLAFSALPGAGHCPGAGACLKFCYSFKAWRYPAAFCRQAQNTILLQSKAGQSVILKALDKFKQDTPLDFRLYVDGDFSTQAILKFWMQALESRAWLRCYGYSKSFDLLLAYNGEFPSNYMVNLSSGHKHRAAKIERMRKLSVTRGEFIAVDIGHKVKTSDHGTREHNVALRAAHGAKAFTCPGKCGTCTPTGHACGSNRFRGVDIIIAAH